MLGKVHPVQVNSQDPSHLKVKIKSMSSMQKVATLSIVFIRTTSCLRRAGRKRTSLSTRKRRKVLSTERPPSACPIISHTLGNTHVCLSQQGQHLIFMHYSNAGCFHIVVHLKYWLYIQGVPYISIHRKNKHFVTKTVFICFYLTYNTPFDFYLWGIWRPWCLR